MTYTQNIFLAIFLTLFPINVCDSLNIRNLDHFLSPFENCLVHAINYEGATFISSTPLILSRYIPLRAPKHFQKRSKWYPGFSVAHVADYPLYPYEYATASHWDKWNSTYPDPWDYYFLFPTLDRRMKARWTCYARFYLLPPTPKCPVISRDWKVSVDESNATEIQLYDMVYTGKWCHHMDPAAREFTLKEVRLQ